MGYSMGMTKDEDKAPTTEALLRAALKAQFNRAEREYPGGGHDLVAALPSAEQKIVMSVLYDEK